MQELQIDDYDLYCRWSYDQLRIKQPHLETEGLWKEGGQYYIKCKDLSVTPFEGEIDNIVEHFENNVKPIGAPVRLVEDVSENSVKVEERSLEELIHLSGVPRTWKEVYHDLLIELPKSFPDFILKSHNQKCLILVKKPLTKDQVSFFEQALKRLQIPLKFIIEVDEEVEEIKKKASVNISASGIYLLPSRTMQNISADLRRVWERDEDFWIDNRENLAFSSGPESYLDSYQTWTSLSSKCFIDASVFPVNNIRNYLSLFEEILIVPPLQNHHDQILESLGVTEDEIIKLVELGRVKLIFPQSLIRYKQRFLEQLVDENKNDLSEKILLSRKLAYYTVCEFRNRNPLLYPPLGVSERKEILEFLTNVSKSGNLEEYKMFIDPLVSHLTRTWSIFEETLHRKGAMGTSILGLSPLIAEMLKRQTGKDLLVELDMAGSAVEWSGTFDATLFPTNTEKYSNQRTAELLASIYSGVPRDWVPTYTPYFNLVIDQILAISKDIPVIEFAKSFRGPEINRFRELVSRITKHEYNEDELAKATKDFNEKVKDYESRIKRINSWGIKTVIMDSVGTVVPFSGLMGHMISKMVEIGRERNQPVGEAIDKVISYLHRTEPDAILVSSMRNKIKNLL